MRREPNQTGRIDSRLRQSVGRCWRAALWIERHLTRRLRVLPDFLIIGAQRCGTTSLFRYLERHPSILPAAVKEVHYFDDRFPRGDSWYRSHFPLSLRMRGHQTGEASPYYLFHPHVPRRVAEILPSAKLIALLRNPVDRAWSQYHHERRFGFETATFEEAIERETERLAGEVETMLRDESHVSLTHRHHSYLARGRYAEQLRHWSRYVPLERMLCVKSEDLYDDARSVVARTFEYLELPPFEAGDYPAHNAVSSTAMDPETRARLVRYFAPHNEELYGMLGRDLGWDAT